MTATGAIDLDGDVDITIDAHNISAGLLQPWLRDGVPLSGSADVAADITGPVASPLVRGSVEVAEPIYPDPSLPEEEDHFRMTVAYTRRLEEAVRRNPEQWLWIHRRWRSGGEEPAPAWLARHTDSESP